MSPVVDLSPDLGVALHAHVGHLPLAAQDRSHPAYTSGVCRPAPVACAPRPAPRNVVSRQPLDELRH
ncbi:MAG: hypothetical protein V9G15_06960 [Dermatophilaceae bacterium]